MDTNDTKAIIRDMLDRLPPAAVNNPLRSELSALLAEPSVIQKPFIKTISWTGLAGAGVTPAQWSLDAAAPFLIRAGSYFADIALAIQTDSTRVIPLVNVQLGDSGTGETFFDAPVPIPCVFGAGGAPFIWPVPKLMPANSVLLATPLNRTAGTTYNITLCFHGVRLVKQP